MLVRLFRCFCLLSLVVVAPTTNADEGMWLFNAAPKDKIKAKYGFELSQAWLDHVRLSSVRFNNGGSGSFVSADGLVFTNHHVGATCIHQLSTGGRDYMKTGFFAKTRAEEGKCPDLELNVLESMDDVTEQVTAALRPGMSAAETGTAQRAARAAIEKDCNTKTGLRCDVITLYSGSMYHLYRYKKYTDVRLVFAPEFDAAFFGGDPDNFTYPRYDLDISFFHIYENDRPVRLNDYLSWSPNGVKEGDLVFVSGNPGNTDRLLTMSQLAFLRDTQYPFLLQSFHRRDALLKKFSAESAENARIAQEDMFGIENAIKAFTGEQSGLNDDHLMRKKQEEEQKLKAAVKNNPKLAGSFGDPWDQIDKATKIHKEIFLPLSFVERRNGFRGDLAYYARILVRAAEEKKKPNGERLPEYRESGLPSLEQQLFSTAPVYKSLETALLSDSLAEMQERLGSDYAVVQKALAGKAPQERAQELISGTKLQDVAERKRLYDGGEAAVQDSNDPLIVLMRSIHPDMLQLRKRYDDEIDSVEKVDGAKIAKARFEQGGLSQPPDATFTLRLSYGAVRGYEENGKHVPYFTTIGGGFEHAAAHGNKPPYQLPESWMSSKSKLKLDVPLNFVSTPDIIGGNSGSPVINQQGEAVGIIFDGNIESLPLDFVYDDTKARAVSVDARGIIEALDKIYGAATLVNELTRSQAARAKGATGTR